MPSDDKTAWTAAQEAILIRVLKQAKQDGLQAENGWKPQTYTNVVEALAGTESESGGIAKAVSHVKSRYQRLKAEYREVKKLRDASGFGWDPDRQVVTASADVWEAYIMVHPKAKPWRKKPFPLYDDLAEIIDGVVADGRAAFRPGRYHSTANTLSRTDDGGNLPAVHHTADKSMSPSQQLMEESSDKSNDDISDVDAPLVPAQKNITQLTQGKRAATPDDGEASNPKKRGRPSGAAAIFALSESIDSVVSAINTTSSGPSLQVPQTSPQRKTAAIQAIEKDEELSDAEMVEVADMIRERTDVADAYLALTKKTTRTTFLQKSLSRYRGM